MYTEILDEFERLGYDPEAPTAEEGAWFIINAGDDGAEMYIHSSDLLFVLRELSDDASEEDVNHTIEDAALNGPAGTQESLNHTHFNV